MHRSHNQPAAATDAGQCSRRELITGGVAAAAFLLCGGAAVLANRNPSVRHNWMGNTADWPAETVERMNRAAIKIDTVIPSGEHVYRLQSSGCLVEPPADVLAALGKGSYIFVLGAAHAYFANFAEQKQVIRLQSLTMTAAGQGPQEIANTDITGIHVFNAIGDDGPRDAVIIVIPARLAGALQGRAPMSIARPDFHPLPGETLLADGFPVGLAQAPGQSPETYFAVATVTGVSSGYISTHMHNNNGGSGGPHVNHDNGVVAVTSYGHPERQAFSAALVHDVRWQEVQLLAS